MDKVLQSIYPSMTAAADFLSNTNRLVQAIELWKECLTFLNNKHLEKENDLARKLSMMLYHRLCLGYAAIYNLSPAIEYGKKLLVLLRKCKRKKKESDTAGMLAILYYQKGEYKEAQQYLQKALTMNTKIGDKDGQASCYINLGNVFHSVGEYAKAEEYHKKALPITTEIDDKHRQASCYMSLGNVSCSVGEYGKAKEYLQKALTIKTEIADKHGQASCYINLGNVFHSVGEYAKAEESVSYTHLTLPTKRIV